MHPRKEIYGFINLSQNALKVVSPHKGQTDQLTEESLHMNPWPMEKNPPNPYPNLVLKHQ
jgi:hypothetical protein